MVKLALLAFIVALLGVFKALSTSSLSKMAIML